MPLHIWTQRDYDSMHKIYTKSQDGVGKSAQNLTTSREAIDIW